MKKAVLIPLAFVSFAYVQAQEVGLRAYYKFNNTLWDYSGNSNHGTVIDTLFYTDGVKCQSVIIANNKTNAIKLPNNVMDGLSDFSITFFGKISGFNNSNNFLSGANAARDNEFILSYNTVGYYVRNGWQLWINGSSYSFSTDITMNDLKWHQIVVSRTGNKASLYIDRIKVGEDINVGSGVINVDAGGLIIGQDQDCVGGCFESGQNWNGEIDELKIYEKVLNQTEINDLFTETACKMVYYDTVAVEKVHYDTVAVTDTLIIDVAIAQNVTNSSICQIKMFPNPTKESLNIALDSNYGLLSDYSFKIISSDGTTISESKINKNMFNIDLSTLGGTGLYFFQLIDSNNKIIEVKKIVLE